MAGNYKKKSAPQRSGNLLGQLLLIFVVFVAGYMSASLFDLTRLMAWVNTSLLAKNSAQLIIKPGVQQAQLPKPKFEFYTLLANEKVAGSSSQAPAVQPAQPAKVLPLHEPLAPVATLAATTPAPVVAAEKAPAVVASSNENYLVQVASFKSMQEAERMKASLAMKGIDAKIATINQGQMYWYRVVIGPFSSKARAQQAQQAFARSEHIMGMIRRMDA